MCIIQAMYNELVIHYNFNNSTNNRGDALQIPVPI